MVLFIDGLAQGILIPILTNTIIQPTTHVLVQNLSHLMRNWLYGAILSVFFLCWFLGAPILSSLSDTLGRKRCLLYCLWGTFTGFLITGLAFLFHSLTLIFLGRIIDGVTCGSQAIAKAAVIDHCPTDRRAQYIAIMILAATIGMIVGPVLGGLFFNQSLLHPSTPATPLFIAALLSVINIICLMIFYHEKNTNPTPNQTIPWSSALTSIHRGFTSPRIGPLLTSFLLMMIGWTSYQFYTTSYLAQQFHLHGLKNAIFFASIGIGACLGFSSVVFFEKQSFSPSNVVTLGYGILSLMIAGTLLTNSVIAAWGFAIVGTFMLAQGYSFMMKAFSQKAEHTQQGWVMGIASSCAALATGIAILISGPLASYNIALPLWVDIGLIIIGLLLAHRSQNS